MMMMHSDDTFTAAEHHDCSGFMAAAGCAAPGGIVIPLECALALQKPILAQRFKTRLCKNVSLQGRCAYQRRCMFAHGADELRTEEQNLADGLTTEEAIRDFQLGAIDAARRQRRRERAALRHQRRKARKAALRASSEAAVLQQNDDASSSAAAATDADDEAGDDGDAAPPLLNEDAADAVEEDSHIVTSPAPRDVIAQAVTALMSAGGALKAEFAAASSVAEDLSAVSSAPAVPCLDNLVVSTANATGTAMNRPHHDIITATEEQEEAAGVEEAPGGDGAHVMIATATGQEAEEVVDEAVAGIRLPEPRLIHGSGMQGDYLPLCVHFNRNRDQKKQTTTAASSPGLDEVQPNTDDDHDRSAFVCVLVAGVGRPVSVEFDLAKYSSPLAAAMNTRPRFCCTSICECSRCRPVGGTSVFTVNLD